ncbi:MAG: hypothetical protein K1X38_03860 [Microthrixaceae bacterium]|nr:hypothetical protein [Microthrixaceae bacterium]
MNVRLGMRQLVSGWAGRRREIEDERYDDLRDLDDTAEEIVNLSDYVTPATRFEELVAYHDLSPSMLALEALAEPPR